MHRVRGLAITALAALSLTGCDDLEGNTGTITGQVSIEGTGIDGVTVTLTNGATTRTSGGGTYRFSDVPAEVYNVIISGYPADAVFERTAELVIILADGSNHTVNFTGSYIRTSSIRGRVTAEGRGLDRVTVRLTGPSDAAAITAPNGEYALTNLRAGTYQVAISGFDSNAVAFASTTTAVTVSAHESRVISFDGTFLRTAGIQGQVIVEGKGLEGVNVSLVGGPDGAHRTTTTDVAGLYTFAQLRAGDYVVGISGYDSDAYEFEVTSQNVTLALGETANVRFDGTPLRSSGIDGLVSANGEGIGGVTVTLSGTANALTTTDAGGRYAISGLAPGDYTVTISGYDTAEYTFEDSQDVTLEADSTATVNFEGTALRTAGINGTVTADGEGVAGAIVTLNRVISSTASTVVETRTTPDDGTYAFGNLTAGTYRVEVSVDDDELSFAVTSWQGPVVAGGTARADFAGTILRTASIGGTVTVDGEGVEGVAVTLGGDAEATDTTSTGGSYGFTGLRKGSYWVGVETPDTATYSLVSDSLSVDLAVGEARDDLSFTGTALRQGAIRGQVNVEGEALAGVTVTLSGAAEAEQATGDDGVYSFEGLGVGIYTVTVTNPDTVAYVFETDTATVELGIKESRIRHFAGAHTRTASVSGRLYLDSNPNNDAYDVDAEDLLEHVGIPVLLVAGAGNADFVTDTTDSTGAYAFPALKRGEYRVLVNETNEVRAALDAAGLAYNGAALGISVTVAAGARATVHLPIDIARQTVGFRARMGTGKMRGGYVEGVKINVYASSDDAQVLGSATTDSTGLARVMFDRVDAADNEVFAQVDTTTLPTEHFALTNARTQTVAYPTRSPYHDAGDTITMVNRKAEMRFAARTIETARSGGTPLEGWDTEYVTGDPGSSSATPVDLDATDSLGAVAFHVLAEAADLPARYTVRLADTQAGALGELFEQTPVPGEDADSGAVTLTYTHEGLTLPGDTVDLGEIEVRFTTQSLVVGVHWERDHEGGYTTEGIYGDERPTGSRDALEISLLVGDGQGHLFPYRNDDPDHDINVNGHRRNPGESGLVVYRNLPADIEFTVDIDIHGDRLLVSRGLVNSWQDLGAFDVGAFGSESGGGPEVRLCPQSSTYGRSACSTFAYVWTNSEVWGWVGSADYGGDPTPNDTITDRFGVSAPDVFANGLTVDLDYKGGLFAYEGSTEVGEKNPFGEFVVGDGEFRFTGVPTGRYTLSVSGNDDWGAADDVTFLLFQQEDTETGARQALSVTVPYLKTSISGTVVNDANRDDRVSYSETVSGIQMELLRVEGSGGRADAVATGLTDTTDIIGRYSFTDIIEGPYVVRASNEDYFVAGTNTEPIDRSPVLTTDARPEQRAITSGDALPVWDHATGLIDADAGTSGNQSDPADFTDADFVVVFGTGSMSGMITRIDDGNTTDTDADPDPFGGLTVHVDHCEASADGTSCQQGRFGTRVSVLTEDDGTWQAHGLREGHHLVTVDLPADWNYGTPPGSNQPRRSYFEQLRGTEASEDSLDFHLVPEITQSVGSVSGRVTRTDDGGTTDTDSDPDPFGGITVRVDYCEAPAGADRCQPGRFGERVSVETRNDGTWQADGLREGYYLVTVDVPGSWEYGAPPGSTQPVRSYFEQLERASATEDSLDFHLVPREVVVSDGTLSGRVTRADDGGTTDSDSDPDPFAGLNVNLDYCEAPADANNCQPGRFANRVSVETQDDGTWEAENLQEGFHQVTVDKPVGPWEYGPPPGRDEPIRQYFVEVEGQTGTSADQVATSASAFSQQAEDDTLDFHFVPRADGADRHPAYGVLVLFYNSTAGPIWEEQGNWLTSRPVSEWQGVVLDDDDNVVELVVSGNNLKYTPTPLLDSLVHLRRLDLSSNGLRGIPDSFGNFDSLRVLDLSGNNLLKGSIPTTFGNLTKLDTLDLARASFSGTIPTELGNLTGLEFLDISHSDLTGSIPTELGDMTSLKRLDLAGNDLTGTIPTELGDLSNLEVLDLADNGLTGTITTELGDLTNLLSLNLGGNELTGAVPDALTALTKLHSLRLGDNQLTGIPSDMSGMAKLRWVWLNDKDLSGAFPASLLGLPLLSGLNISGNALTGTIPDFGTRRLDWLELGDNQFSGSIPAALGDMVTLYTLNLSGNSLSGAIPTALGSLGRIKTLWLHDNALTGNIPTEFGSLTTLNELLVNGNSGLTGTLPSSLTSLTRLFWFAAQGTDLCAPTDSAFQTWLRGVSRRNVSNCP